jgi:hypothetical protein
VLHGCNGSSGIAAAQDAALHAELQWTGSVQQVRPFQRDFDQLTLDESVAALEEQAGASHIGKFPAAMLPGYQRIRQLQSEGKTALSPPVTSSVGRRGARMREVSPVKGKQVRAIRIVKTRPLKRGRSFETVASAYQRF